MIATMSPELRKFVLSIHVTGSVGLIGAIAAFLALAAVGLASHDVQLIRGAYPAMELIARFVIVPLAATALLSGLVQSLGTPWGLFRHYWILAKLLLTTFAIVVLLVKMALIGYAARLSEQTILPRDDLHAAGLQLVVHAAGGLLVLLLPAVLSIYKPQGLTAYGRRKLTEQIASTRQLDRGSNGSAVVLAHRGAVTVTLRRAYVATFIFVVIAAHIVVLHVMSGGLHHH